uniref:BTB domain-containing protein n=1 Tax=Acrobeloides nanus TaxID=290746 RepID=A0A914D425_9BILA
MVIDYSCKTPLRQFELIIEGRSLFVNQYFLAEISPYFYALCFSETFEESRQGRATLDDITYDDILELLNSICPDEDFGLGPRIDAKNFALLIHLSNRLLLMSLKQQLNEILKGDLQIFQMLSCSQMVEILFEAMVAQFSELAIVSLCKRISEYDESEVNKLINVLPAPYNKLMQEKVQKFRNCEEQRFNQTFVPRSSYNWNQFHMRLFF